MLIQVVDRDNPQCYLPQQADHRLKVRGARRVGQVSSMKIMAYIEQSRVGEASGSPPNVKLPRQLMSRD
jgi:hypothetical protein